MRLIQYEGRKPVKVQPREWLPGLDAGTSSVQVTSFSADIKRYTEMRRVIKVGSVRIPIGRWNSR